MFTNNKNKTFVVGIDDATKCPCIGSIFIAGVLAEQKVIKQWKKIGIKDSKVINPIKRRKLDKIIKETAIKYSIKQITPQLMKDNSFNLNDWEMLKVLDITNFVCKKINPLIIFIDNWEVNNIKFFERLNLLLDQTSQDKLKNKNIDLDCQRLKTLNYYPQHYADEIYTIVGAASILAKTASEDQFAEYKKLYGDFGSGSPADPKTRTFVWKHRKNPLPIIRTSWLTYKTLSKLEKIEDDLIINKIKNKPKVLKKGRSLKK